jgi:hypothetical protein
MDIDRAIELVRKLADGVDPATGERFPAGSPYQQADTVRALYLALDGLDRLKRVKERQADGPPKAGRPWTKDEEQRMLQQFDAKVDVAAIAQELNRTSGAIWARLEKVGRIQRKDFARPEPVERAGSTPHPPTAVRADFGTPRSPRSDAPPRPAAPSGGDGALPF